jgi:hypothetical protein
MRSCWVAMCAVLGCLGVANVLSADIPASERRALEAFFHATGGNNWNYANGETPWLTQSTSECQWAGISCNPAQTEVQGISLAGPERNLVGQLPEEIGDLRHLVTLQVSNNPGLGGVIPSRIVESALENFFGDNNHFTGGIEWLAGLPRLRKISLRFNDLSGSIPPGIGALSLLEELQMEGNQLSGPLPHQFGTATGLRILNLTGNQLSGQISDTIGGLQVLTILRLDQNRLTGSVPASLGNLRDLTILDLGGNPLSGVIPSTLGDLGNLKQLSLGQANLEGSIPDTLGNLSNLEILSLGTNQLSGAIPSHLASATALKELYLDNNRLHGSVPESFVNLQELMVLRLSSNQLQGPMPEGLATLGKLATIELGWNALYAEGEALREFLNARTPGGDFEATQTLPPAADSIRATFRNHHSVLIQWRPIAYTTHEGGYRILMSGSPDGPFARIGEVADKTKSSSILEVRPVRLGESRYFQIVSFTRPHSANSNRVTSSESIVVRAYIPGVSSLPSVLQFINTNLDGVEGERKRVKVARLLNDRGIVAVKIEARSGSARSGKDFFLRREVWVKWRNGEIGVKTVSVDLLGDDEREPVEFFRLELTDTMGNVDVVFGDSVASVGIADRRIGTPEDEGPVSSGGESPVVAVDEAGTKLVAWIETLEGVKGVYCQSFDLDGNIIDEKRQVGSLNSRIDVGSLNANAIDQGTFLLTWHVSEAVVSRRVVVKTSTTVTEPPPPPVTTKELATLSSGAVASHPARGESYVVWQEGANVYGRLLSRSGAPLGRPVRVDGREPGAVRKVSAAFLETGESILVVWEQARVSGDIDIFARLLDSLGRPIAQEARISFSNTAERSPRVAGGRDSFVIVWQRDSEPAKEPFTDIAAITLGRAGELLGPEVRLNQSRDGYQADPVVAASPNGDCVALWLTDRAAAPRQLKSVRIPGCRAADALAEQSLSRTSSALPRALDLALDLEAKAIVVLSLDDVEEGNGQIVAFSEETATESAAPGRD